MELKSALSRGSIIQANENAPEAWTGCVLIVDEVKDWGVQAFLRIPAEGEAYIRLRANQFDILTTGKAVLMPED